MGILHNLVLLSLQPLTSVLSSLLTRTSVGSNIMQHHVSHSPATTTRCPPMVVPTAAHDVRPCCSQLVPRLLLLT
eukprot:13544992-Ditylum_brightwellii.AAC.1